MLVSIGICIFSLSGYGNKELPQSIEDTAILLHDPKNGPKTSDQISFDPEVGSDDHLHRSDSDLSSQHLIEVSPERRPKGISVELEQR